MSEATAFPPSDTTLLLQPDDVRAAARLAHEILAPVSGGDWTCLAHGLEWDCRATLEHMVNALDTYHRYLATPTLTRNPRMHLCYPDLTLRDLLTYLELRAGVLAVVAAATAPTVRSFHNWGRSDPLGYVAMGCAEILLHTDDIIRSIGQAFQPPEALSQGVVARLFPWAPTEVDPWSALRWATGRQDLPGHGRTPPNWAWHAAPVAEWDGTIKTWDSYPAR